MRDRNNWRYACINFYSNETMKRCEDFYKWLECHGIYFIMGSSTPRRGVSMVQFLMDCASDEEYKQVETALNKLVWKLPTTEDMPPQPTDAPDYSYEVTLNHRSREETRRRMKAQQEARIGALAGSKQYKAYNRK